MTNFKHLQTLSLFTHRITETFSLIQFGRPILPDGLENKLLKVKLSGRAANKPAEHGLTPEWKAARKALYSLHFLSMERRLKTTKDCVSPALALFFSTRST